MHISLSYAVRQFFSSSLLILPSQSPKLAIWLKSESVVAVPLLWKKLKIKTALGDSLHGPNHHLIPTSSSKKLRLPLIHKLQLVGAVIIRRLVRDIFSIPGKNFISCSMELLDAYLPQRRFCSRSQAHFFGW